MSNPTKAQVQTVIDSLEKVLPQASKECNLAMRNGSLCGTVHCHAGWYAIAKGMSSEDDENCVDEANQMASDLGFSGMQDLMDWAQSNPRLWGTPSGHGMFCAAEAFESDTRPDGAKCLQDIVDHWKEVQSRLIE